jgi:lauroyl/myristoyl acyltransferase
MRRDTEVVGYHGLSRSLEDGGGAVLVSAHLGELEVAATWLTEVAKREVVAVVDTVSPWWRQLFFDTVRRACGVQLRRQAEVTLEELAADLAAGRIVLLMLDRRCRSATVEASFMGRQADLPAAAWALSVKAGAPVLTGTTVRSAGGGCTLRFGDPRDGRRFGAGGLIRALAADLEAEIRRAPAQWHVPADLRQLPFLVPRLTAPRSGRTPSPAPALAR